MFCWRMLFLFLFSQAGQRPHYPAPPFPLFFVCFLFCFPLRSFHLVDAFLDPVTPLTLCCCSYVLSRLVQLMIIGRCLFDGQS
ncbi:hypothetical protein QR685DRAFT_520443 [Neurospora intermedia]|uniref:Secreted peptide n=1 Tax=Neurospora intermedia TaxID=5142 RepID=A0ABR3DGT7_NEUIN